MQKRSYSTSGTIAVIFFLIVAAFFIFSQGPDAGKYEFLKEPRIVKMPDQKMIEVAAEAIPTSSGAGRSSCCSKSTIKSPEFQRS